jgi:sugar lactone lactonase YvrE
MELGTAEPVPFGKPISKTVSDGIVCDKEGRIYVTDFEHFALSVTSADGNKVQTLVEDRSLLRWPDGITLKKGTIFISSSAIHEVVAGDHHKNAPFHIVSLDLGLCGEKVQL